VAGYGAIPHGVAVAEGIRFAASVAERVLEADPAWSAAQDRLLSALGLGRSGCPYEPGALLAAMRSDKKTRAEGVRMVLSRGPGDWDVRAIDDELLATQLQAWCRSQFDEGRGER